MFKKSILVAVALTFVGAPLAQARDYQPLRKAEQHRYEPNRPSYGKQYKKPNEQRYYKKWSKGQRYGDWRRHQEVRDYKRYGLRKPGRGQHWVKVDNQYLLITAATGLIAAMMMAR